MENKHIIGIVLSAIAVLVGLALFTGSFSENVGTMTNTETSATNFSFTLPANGASKQITECEQKALTTAIINQSDAVVIGSGNYTISQAAGTDGYLAAFITVNDAQFASNLVNITCSYEPYGYIDDSGSRGIVRLIAIFMALLIMIAASPNLKEVLKSVGR